VKLIYCTECNDIVCLVKGTDRKCQCLHAGGRYLDNLNAVYWGTAVPLGLDNNSLVWAVRRQPRTGWGDNFNAFVIPKECATFKFIPEGTDHDVR